MKSLLEFITDRENIPKREDMPKEDMPKEDIHKEDMPKEDTPKEDKDTPKEDIPKMDKDTHKEDNIINNEKKVNENRVNDFKHAVSSIGFRKIKVYRF